MGAFEKKPLKVDFSDIADSGRPEKNVDSELKIAVAAMISPRYTYRYYADLLTLIGERMARKVRFIQKKTYAQVNKMLEQGDLDLAFVCSGPYVTGRRAFGAEILVVPVCHGKSVYHSYFIVSELSGIRSFEQLRGKRFAFTDPLSNTGYMVPVYYLARRDETPEAYFKSFFFTHSHDNSIRAVAGGVADGAAVDSLIYDFMAETNPDLTGKTMIVETSPPYGIPPVVTPPTLDPEIRARLKEIFLSVHKDPKGRPILEALQIDRFAEGDDADYDTVRRLQKFIRDQSHR